MNGAAREPAARYEVALGHDLIIIEGPPDPDDAVRAAVARGDASIPHWGLLWPMSIALARCVRSSLLVPLRGRVLEVGCGLGLVGIGAAKAGASVTMTDIEPDAVRWAARNAEANRVDARACVFDWNDDPDPAWAPDLIVGSDVLYAPGAADALARLILRLGSPALLGDPSRAVSANAESELVAQGLRCTTTVIPGGRIMWVRGQGGG